jgi:asparagine synthase (glutamine-hydrolysing)
MSAITGLWRLDGRPDAGEGVARMLTAQAIYGPHAGAQWADGSIAIGRRLMRLLPEDAHDRQPLVGAEGRTVLVADLRLDNRDELLGALQISAEQARTLCDAAILLTAWERWTEACLDRLVGDYAFAIWEGALRRLILVRDPLGMRPLHYHRSNRLFAFSSMAKGLHALPDIPYAPDEDRVAELLALLPETGSRSYFKGIERVEPGHCVTVTAEGLSARRFWEPQRHTITLSGAENYAEALRHHVEVAVRSRLRGARDVAAHLSGGFDSSTIAATAARLLAPASGRVVAFTSVPREGYDGASRPGTFGDEGPHAAATAAMHPNMEHVLVRCDGRSPLDNLDRNFFLFERPILNLCNDVWGAAINDAARARKLSILLTGQMGNMSLSYGGSELLAELVRSGRWAQWAQKAIAQMKGRQLTWKGVLAQSFSPWLPRPVWLWLSRLSGRDYDVRHYTALSPARLVELDIPRLARERNLDLTYRPWKDGFAMRLWVLRRVDMGNYTKGNLGGWGIDMRDPTADRRLIEFCLSVPLEQYVADGVPRALARRAFADRLPKAVIEERRKGYQAVDWHERVTAARDRLGEELERLDACAPAAKALDVAKLRKLLDNWPTGGWERDEVMMPYRLALLRGLSAGHFLRRASRSN